MSYKSKILQASLDSQLTHIDSLMLSINESKMVIEKTKKQVIILEKKLEEITLMAQPNSIEFYAKEVKKNNENNFETLIQFKPLKNEPLGLLEFQVTIPLNSDSEILSLKPSTLGVGFSWASDSFRIFDDGKKATLIYSLISIGDPIIEITLSKPTTINISCNLLESPIEIDIK